MPSLGGLGLIGPSLRRSVCRLKQPASANTSVSPIPLRWTERVWAGAARQRRHVRRPCVAEGQPASWRQHTRHPRMAEVERTQAEVAPERRHARHLHAKLAYAPGALAVRSPPALLCTSTQTGSARFWGAAGSSISGGGRGGGGEKGFEKAHGKISPALVRPQEHAPVECLFDSSRGPNHYLLPFSSQNNNLLGSSVIPRV